LIPCNCSECENSQEPYFYIYSSLKKRVEKGKAEIECYESYEMVNVKGLIDDISFTQKTVFPEETKTLKATSNLITPKNKVFISYSHKDEKYKDMLMEHLNVLQNECILQTWDDRQIKPGVDWYEEIQTAMNKATVAVMLISPSFLNSEFIRSEEVPVLLEKREKEGLKVVPIIVEPCLFQEVGWLGKMQCVPKDGKALMGFSEFEIKEKLVEIVKGIAKDIVG